MFKVWRHQAAYGKIEGMFTRVRLLRTLDEQKALIKTIGTLKKRKVYSVFGWIQPCTIPEDIISCNY